MIEGSFKRINNQEFDISTKEQTKTQGADKNTHDLHRQQAMDLGRQRAYTCVRAYMIVERM